VNAQHTHTQPKDEDTVMRLSTEQPKSVNRRLQSSSKHWILEVIFIWTLLRGVTLK